MKIITFSPIKKVRQAMSYAFNSKDILANVSLGLGELTSGRPFS